MITTEVCFVRARIALDAELVLASRIRLHLGDDWKAPEGPSKYIMTGASKNVTPGILQLNGPAAILLHQITVPGRIT